MLFLTCANVEPPHGKAHSGSASHGKAHSGVSLSRKSAFCTRRLTENRTLRRRCGRDVTEGRTLGGRRHGETHFACGPHQRAHSACERWLRREPIFADLCTLLHTHGRSRDRAGPRVPRHRRPHGPRDARMLGPEAHAAGAVTQPPTHTSSRSLPFWTLAINGLHGRNRALTTNVGAWLLRKREDAKIKIVRSRPPRGRCALRVGRFVAGIASKPSPSLSTPDAWPLAERYGLRRGCVASGLLAQP